ncbi:MAG: fasciclin domain-containing protein [Halofilum sp. (in: g-proteobacteria)]|nr:fasciclin domain-containing protein [Halofilum sp. (in: g-proteobacteria)]
MKVRKFIFAVLMANLVALPAFATGMTGMYGSTMGRMGDQSLHPSKDIVQTAVESRDHQTLVTAVKAAGLVETLQGEGPFTVFAPTDSAFAELPAGTVDTLLQPANSDQLTAVLTYHVVAGRVDAVVLANAIESNGGSVTYQTVQSGPLTFRMDGNNVLVEDARGSVSRVAAADLFASNGVIHVVDGVLLPN